MHDALAQAAGRRADRDPPAPAAVGLRPALAPNAEARLRQRQRLGRLYPLEALAQTVHIASLCHFSLGDLRYEYPEELVPEGRTAIDYLREEVDKGRRQRFPEGMQESWAKQLEEELKLIEAKQYEHFFLTVHDIVRQARHLGILCRGAARRPTRWSATASISPRSIPSRRRCCSAASSRPSATSRPISTSTSSTSGARR